MNYRYLELDSMYRNRNEWPLPGEFQIPISQTGRKGQFDAVDPVSLATPLTSWTSNDLILGGNSATVTGALRDAVGTATSIQASADNLVLVLQTSSPNLLQQKSNYYRNLVLVDTSNDPDLIIGRIDSYTFLYTSGGSDFAQVTVIPASPIFGVTAGGPSIDGRAFSIRDPTDLTSSTNPLFFVPAGRYQSDAYNNYILYNENLNEFRHVSGYDSDTGIITLNTSTSATSTASSGPLSGWTVTQNYSLRREYPSYPLLGNANPTIVASDTYQPPMIAQPYPNPPITPAPVTYNTGYQTVVINITLGSHTDDNSFQNYALRLMPTTLGGGSQYYDYGDNGSLIPPANQARVITSSIYDSVNSKLILGINSPFVDVNGNSLIPTVGTPVEIMQFSYDNLNPFVYTGSMVSQQDMVCYEIQLLDVVLPNATLIVGEGSRIAFYPYVYVTLQNVSSSGAGLTNVLYSNNPNATQVTFRAPIYDIQNPTNSAYIKIDGDGMVQTIKFKPNDNLFFSVTLPNGQVFNTVITDTTSPAPPNNYAQVSALFGMKRIEKTEEQKPIYRQPNPREESNNVRYT